MHSQALGGFPPAQPWVLAPSQLWMRRMRLRDVKSLLVLSPNLESHAARLSFSRNLNPRLPEVNIYQVLTCTWDCVRHSRNNPRCLRCCYIAEWAPPDPSWAVDGAVALDEAWARQCHCRSHGSGASHPAWMASRPGPLHGPEMSKSFSLTEGGSVWNLEEGLSFSPFLCETPLTSGDVY
ncbi:unnamed protein product [Nyctereutes procyonoides]|uniref:(raccoon dog) hypothetical protein n=1 Tax=Nyctereutes procyonoides TaxID=34880 RepID=A0A811Z740_NYCPR|nr:unnamed protein product [Nyctereutes procyonoides]